jgi:Ca2+-binding RTX toxin-like protein
MDSIAGALADYALNGPNSVSIYRDTDPTPSNAVTGGPGNADPSQYWTQNGRLGGFVYNYLGNSDTLISTGGATMDGGAGSDSMIGAGGDTFYISSGGPDIYYDNAGVLTNRAKNNHAGYSDSYIPSRAAQWELSVVLQTVILMRLRD